jgi:hypothetical protein
MPGATAVKFTEGWYAPPSIAYSTAPNGAIISIDPLGKAQVGCATIVAVGTPGAVGAGLIVVLTEGVEIQVLSDTKRAIAVKLPGASDANVLLTCQIVPPSMEYSSPIPDEYTISPNGSAQVACVTVFTVGATGTSGVGLMV